MPATSNANEFTGGIDVKVAFPEQCVQIQYVVPALNVNEVVAVFTPVVEQSKFALS